MAMKPTKSMHPAGFFTRWNLTPNQTQYCAVYELLRVSRPELELRMYKWMEKTVEDGEELMEYEHHILHKGFMYKVRWQYESFEAYALKDKWPDTTGFIISFRKMLNSYGGVGVALVQRDRS